MSLPQSSKLKSDVDQLDDLVKDLLTEVNRPIGTNTTNRSSNNNNTTNNNNNNNKYSTSSSSYSYSRQSNNDNNDISNAKLPSSLRASSYAQASTLNNQKRNDFDANTVSGLIDGSSLSSNGTQREEQRIKTTREERIRIKRGGGGSGGGGGGGGGSTSDGTEIPITSSSMKTTTTTTTNKPVQSTAARDQLSIDEQLIDSLLESVQNTLRKRSQQQQTTWTTDIPIHHQQPTNNRRTYSSSAAYTDSVHRMDPTRGRFPIKLVRNDSPTSTLSSRRPYSRQDNRDGYTTTVTSASTTAIPTHFRATSEPAPDGPIELRRMDLVRSPSRTYLDGPPNEYYHYSRSTLPTSGVRVRGHDYSGYETDTGLVTSRTYAPRYYGGPPPPPSVQHIPPPMHYPYYTHQPANFARERHHEGYSTSSSGGGGGGQRSMLRPDGYDTDTGLISSGRLRMTRTLPPRMAAIPETLVVNNRMVSSSNLNNVPTNLRGSSFLNETNTLRNRTDNISGYETDSGMNIRQQNYFRQQVPIDIQYGDSGWVGKQSTIRPISQQQQQQRFIDNNQRYRSQDQLRSASIPIFTQDTSTTISRLPDQQISITNKSQQKRTINTLPSSTEAKQQWETTRKDVTVLPTFFPGSVGLSNPPSNNKQQMPASPELKRKFSDDHSFKKSTRPQCTIIETTILPVSNDSNIPKPQIFSTTAEIIPTVNADRFDNQTTTITSKTPQTPTFPVATQTYNQNMQTRVGNSSFRNQEENSRRSSISSAAESDVVRNGAYQAHNVSQYWYKEKLSREDAINLLKTKPPGTFLVRDSQGFPGSYGLAIKVETLPAGIQAKQGADPNAELVRHYLIERTPTGHVRLKGCPNEPDFANLSALVYQHSITPLALPIKLVLPTADITEDYRSLGNQQQQQHETLKKVSVKDLLEKGAACNVVYLNNVDVESLSGQMAVNKALRSTFENADRLQATIVHFKVSNTGITLTDTKKKLFSRRHFPKEYVTYCGVDYETDRYWTHQFPDLEMLLKAKCFGFVSKKINGNNRSAQAENECHIFAEIDRTQPSTAIVNFVSKVMIGSVPV
ncbi:unnamed protein product [Rotaria sordida]|uniref:SH2 domain-containing protein n=1 Tax=Rotaria sordida TaxID=392033 RepID=A0A814MZJ6_9BILA|nr:unnamed protein product [Rotaria sordida]CAF1275517.1 unnamed protein product [Rotaria sordida]